MKNYFTFLFLIFCINNFAQDNDIQNEENIVLKFSETEEKPTFPLIGGVMDFSNFFYKSYRYEENQGFGKVIIEFIIEKDGTLSNMIVKEDFGKRSRNEALRVLKSCPQWIPGKKNGKIVRTSHKIVFEVRR